MSALRAWYLCNIMCNLVWWICGSFENIWCCITVIHWLEFHDFDSYYFLKLEFCEQKKKKKICKFIFYCRRCCRWLYVQNIANKSLFFFFVLLHFVYNIFWIIFLFIILLVSLFMIIITQKTYSKISSSLRSKRLLYFSLYIINDYLNNNNKIYYFMFSNYTFSQSNFL